MSSDITLQPLPAQDLPVKQGWKGDQPNQRSLRIVRLIEGARRGCFKGWLRWFTHPDVTCWKTRDKGTGIDYTVYDRADGSRMILEGIRDITEGS